MNEYKFTTEIDVEAEGLELRSELSALTIVDQSSYDLAVERRVAAKTWLKGAGEFFDGIIKPIYSSYKNAMEKKKLVVEPVERTVADLNRELLAWDEAQARIRREEQRRLEEQARREAEEQRLEAAAHAEAMGASAEQVNAVLDEEIVITAPVVAEPTYEKSGAVVYRDNWGGEVTDLKALVKYVAKNPTFIGLLSANPTAVNQMARSLKETMNIPGIKAVNNKVVASGRG
mgnify:CR=1 FL=1